MPPTTSESISLLTAFALLIPVAFAVGTGALLGFLGLLPALPALRRAWLHYYDTPRLVPGQGQILLAFLLMALGSGAGLLMERPPG